MTMNKITLKLILTLLTLFTVSSVVAGNIVVIGNANLTKVDAEIIPKIFTGKVIDVGGINVIAVNAIPGNLRDRFLQTFLKQSDEKYIAYWTVRRYIGKGVPPKELRDAADVINFVQSTPGAIGYIDEADLKPGLNVLVRKKDDAARLYFIDYAQAEPGTIVYIDAGRPGFNLMVDEAPFSRDTDTWGFDRVAHGDAGREGVNSRIALLARNGR